MTSVNSAIASSELLSEQGVEFVSAYHLATLTTMGKDGSFHVVPVGFTLVDGLARIIASGGTQKIKNIEADSRVSICQVEGRRWLTLQGTASIATDPESVALGERLYEERYRPVRVNPERVVIEVTVNKVLGSSGMRAE